MTPPAGPEEVRVPDFEAALKEAMRTIDEYPKLFQPSKTDYNLARAYVALQARVEDERRTAYLNIIGMMKQSLRIREKNGHVGEDLDRILQAWINVIQQLADLTPASRLAKLEQERGR